MGVAAFLVALAYAPSLRRAPEYVAVPEADEHGLLHAIDLDDHGIRAQCAAMRGVAIDADPAGRNGMLIGGQLCKTLDEEHLGLGKIAAKADHLGVIDDRIRREHLVELIPVLAVDRVAVRDHQVLNFLPIGQLLQSHRHGGCSFSGLRIYAARLANSLRSSTVRGPICWGALPCSTSSSGPGSRKPHSFAAQRAAVPIAAPSSYQDCGKVRLTSTSCARVNA